MKKSLIISQYIVAIAMLSGCFSGDNARVSIPPISVPCPTYTSTAQEGSKIGIINVSIGSNKTEGTKSTTIVAAKRPMTFSGLVTTSSVGAGASSGYSSAEYDVTYREAISLPDEINLDLTLENKSTRVLQLNGVVLRAKSSNEMVKIELPKEITNEAKLAPGESIKGEIKVTGLKDMGDLTEIELAIYEIPMEILDNGTVGKRGSISRKISIVKTVQMESCATYTQRETRKWKGNANIDPALSHFVK